MAQFSLVGSPEPFLHVAMRRGDKIYCESNAMVMMEAVRSRGVPFKLSV